MKRPVLVFCWMIGLVCFLSAPTLSQELKCQVQILSNQIQSSDKRVFETLRNSINEFMNTQKWTNDVYGDNERIDCSILLNITEWNMVDEFKGTIQVQARRPVFNSSYDSRLINFVDNNLHFRYLEYDPLEFSESTHISNLTSILSFYAYIIIALDYDSFSPDGGAMYLQKAQNIVINAQNAPEKGWTASTNKKNRYWMVENMLNQIYKPYRQCLYKYHRLGMDKMTEDVNSSRMTITESLELLEKVHLEEPSSFILQLFFDAKADEIVNIYTAANATEKTRIIKLLKKIDPANSTKYNKILKG